MGVEVYCSRVPASREAVIEIDWDRLRVIADQMTERAYAPYSKFMVGAAAQAPDGRIFSGCNVENASYGVTLCAECGLVSNFVANAGSALVAISVKSSYGEFLTPCGRCRQLLVEHGTVGLLVDRGPDQPPRLLSELLPDAFTSADIPDATSGTQ
jgi:cytidine deaminase